MFESVAKANMANGTCEGDGDSILHLLVSTNNETAEFLMRMEAGRSLYIHLQPCRWTILPRASPASNDGLITVVITS